MKSKSKKQIAKIVSVVLATTMVSTMAFGTLSAFAAGANNDGKAIPAYKTDEEARAAARELNTKLTGEGSVLLKNVNNALPLKKSGTGAESITVFGQDKGQGSSQSISGVLKEAGFSTNTNVITATILANATAELPADASDAVKKAKEDAETALATVNDYKGVGVVVLNRGGSEGSDLSVATNEAANDAEENAGWTHKLLAKRDGKDVKHNQMLTADELSVIEYAKTKCDKVVVLLSTSNAMEMYNLEHDEDIDSILWIGRPGTTGTEAIPKLLDGTWNPSGKLVAEWYKDFTADPTWYNSIANVQNGAGSNTYVLSDGSQASSIGLHGVDYSEDIYIGYKYYETVYAEIAAGRLTYNSTTKALSKGAGTKAEADAWHADNVVYPFGYGLSYTSFDMNILDISATSLDASQISSSLTKEAEVKTVKLAVEVTNTGSKAGKEVVEIYSQAPYTVGGIEKASVNLVAYAKTKNLKPGETQTITLEVNLQDMASYDYSDKNGNGFKGYELEKGTYNLYATNTSHVTDATEKVELEITASGDKKGATLALDDYSGNEIENLFSSGRYTSIRTNNVDWNGDGKVDDKDKMFDKEQVLLSRADLVGTFPEAPITTIKTGDTTSIAVNEIPEFSTTATYAVGDVVKVTTVTTGVTGTSSVGYYKYTAAHAAGEFSLDEVETLDGSYMGALVVTEAFAQLMDYYAQYDLNVWDETYTYFSATAGAAANTNIGVDGTKDVYTVGATAIPAIPTLSTTDAYENGAYVALSGKIYQLTAALAEVTILDNGSTVDKASKDYKVGDVVKYTYTNGRRTTTGTVLVTAAIASGDNIVRSGNDANCKDYTAALRLTTDNSTEVPVAKYLTEVRGATLSTTLENGGSYRYSDKLFQGVEGINGYDGNDAGLYDVTVDMMEGWSQLADDDAQLEGIASGDWIYFNELNGIKFNDTSVITKGRFAGMTGVEVWTKFMNQWTWNNFFTACWNGGNNGNAVPNLGITAGGVQDGPSGINGTSSKYTWCCNCTIASTWNVDLGYEQGRIVASTGLFANTDKNETTTRCDQWLNPAINFQRTPFSGRNNEYYAQDGYQAGWYAQAVVRGIQSTGVGSHIKHMFLNDQETNRNSGDLFAWVSEQAIREVYIKPFQIAIQEGGAEGAMSAFARIGGVPTPVNDNMCNLLVRKEWGATNFFFHPDMYSPQANVASEDLMLRTGHNHAPGGNNTTNEGTPANNTYSGRWDADIDNPLTGEKGGVIIGRDVEATGQESYLSNNQWYIVRYSAMIMYSEYANDAHAQNGILKFQNDYQGYAVSATAGNAVVIDAAYKAGEANAQTVEYSATGLPEGLTINSKTGVITGKAASGDYKITVTALFDHWIKVSAEYTLGVTDAATGSGSTTTPASDIQFKVDEGVLKYSVDGTTWTAVASGSGSTGIVGEKGEPGVGIAKIEKTGTEGLVDTYKITLTDETSYNFTVTNGEKGEQGDAGNATFEISEEGNWVIDGHDTGIAATGPKGDKGDTGAQGAQGPKGDTGAQGEAGSGCGSSIAPTVGVVGVALALVAAAVVIARKRNNANE